MTHALFIDAIAQDHEEILKEVNKEEISLAKVSFIIDEISNSTLDISKAEVSQIVQEIISLFREYLFTNVDFRFGWTYPKLLFNKSDNLIIMTPTPGFIKDDKSFVPDEVNEFFKKEEQWNIQRKREWKMAQDKFKLFLDEEVETYKAQIPSYDTETLCAMIVSLRYLKVFVLYNDIMEELAARREKGDPFDYEEYIKKEYLAIPKATINYNLVQEAFEGFKL